MNDILDKLWELSTEFRFAKITEDLAKKKRIAIEEQIATLVPTEDTGQKTVTLKNGAKIVVKRGLNYKANFNGIQDALKNFTDYQIPIKSKTTLELDIAGYEWYRVNCPGVFPHIAQHVSITPKKVSVVLRLAEPK